MLRSTMNSTTNPELVREVLTGAGINVLEHNHDSDEPNDLLSGRGSVALSPDYEEEEEERGDDLAGIEEPIAIYLREIDRVPLLKAVEEVELAMAIEAGEVAKKQLKEGAETTDELRAAILGGADARR